MNILLGLSIIILVLNAIFSLSLIFIERRDPTTTWAWLLILLILPGFGFMLYLLLGQNLSRQKMFKKKIIRDINKKKILNEKYSYHDNVHDGGGKFSELRKMNYNSCGSKYTTNNSVKIYVDGEEKFKQLIEDIKKAKKYIHIEYYIFRSDNLGKKIIDELTKKVKEGLEVRLLVDGMGSRRLIKKHLREYLNAGGKFAIFFPGILPHINTRINYRNHRKIVVIDGQYGYVGGFNVGDEYINRDKKFGFWRDTHVRIKGDAVDDLNERFLLDWCYASKEEIEEYSDYISKKNKEGGDVGIQIITSGPDHTEEYIKNSYIKLINSAKKSVYVETPYLVPDEPVLQALKISALSGIDIRIIIPGKPDHFFMPWVASSYMGELLESGVKIYLYQAGFIHAKTIVVDGLATSIGTANLDIRSFKLNFEVNALIYDDRIAKEYEKEVMKDIENSIEVTLDIHNNRSISLRIKESLIRLVSPIL